MYLKKEKDRSTPLLIVVVIFFTIGLVIGTIVFFHMPKDIINDLKLTFDDDNILKGDITGEIKHNFIAEIMWIILIWVLNNLSFTAPFSVVLVGVRGVIVSFSTTFILYSGNNIKWILGSIIPQMLIAIPIMTIFTVLGIKLAAEKKAGNRAEASFFILGAVFVIITALASLLEVGAGRLFISFL